MPYPSISVYPRQYVLITWDQEHVWAWRMAQGRPVSQTYEVIAQTGKSVSLVGESVIERSSATEPPSVTESLSAREGDGQGTTASRADVPASEADISETIRVCVKRVKGERLPVVSIFPGSDALFRVLSLPPGIEPSQLDTIMEHELPRHLPLPPSVFSCDTCILSQDETATQVLLIAARRNLVQAHLAVLSQAGIRPRRVVPSTLDFAESLSGWEGLADGVSSMSDEAWCAIRLLGSQVDMACLSNAASLSNADSLSSATYLGQERVTQARSFSWLHADPTHEVSATLQAFLKQNQQQSQQQSENQQQEAFPHCVLFHDWDTEDSSDIVDSGDTTENSQAASLLARFSSLQENLSSLEHSSLPIESVHWERNPLGRANVYPVSGIFAYPPEKVH